jgi:putative ABC transport system permease protein
MFKFLPLLLAGLRRHKLRTAFTLASVVVAFLLYGVLAAVRTGFTAGIDVAGADRLMTTHKVSFILSLPISYWQRIRAVPGVREVTHATWFGGLYQDDSNVVQMLPVDPESYLKVYSDYVTSSEDRARWTADRGSALVGREYADRFKWKIGDRVPLRSNIYRRADGTNTWELTIAGFYDAAVKGVDTQQILFHYDYFEESLAVNDENRGRVGWYIVQVAVPEQSAEVSKAVDTLFANSPTETKSSPEKAFMQAFANQAGNIGAMVVAVASAVFFTMLLVTANTMAQSVRERSAEIGVLKTLGFRDRTVLYLVLAESLAITVVGGGVGLSLAAMFVNTLRGAMTQYLSALFLSGAAWTLGFVLIVGLGLVSGAMPAIHALRLRIVDALRQE